MQMNNTTPIHLLLIPYPAKGHIIPLLDLTRRLLTRHPNHLTITFVVTPPFLSVLEPLLSAFQPSQFQPLTLSPPPPSNTPTLLASRIRALHALSDPLLSWFNSHPSPPRVIIFDFFCSWVNNLSSTLRLPRVVFHTSGAFPSSVFYSIWRGVPTNPNDDPGFEVRFDDVPGSSRFKWLELSTLFRSGKPGDVEWDLFREESLSNHTSWGAMFNTCSELEGVYINHFMKEMGHDRVWAIGPLLPTEADVDTAAQRGGTSSLDVLTWLDDKADASVVYICFGSRTSLTVEESMVLAGALQSSCVNFVWCVQELNDKEQGTMPDSEFEDQMGDKGFIIRGWAPQLAILRHRAVGAFLSHCGWNSTLESVSSGVLVIAWPMGADQYFNASLIVDQQSMGLRVQCYGPNVVPKRDELAQLLVDSLDQGKPQRAQVKRMHEAIVGAVNGGSSSMDLDKFVEHLSQLSK